MSIEKLFEKFEDKEFLEFERIPKRHRRSNRPDLHAFLLLDSLNPTDRDIIGGAEHDIIYLDVSETVIEGLDEEKVLELVRCGVMYDEENGGLSMYA